MRISRIVRDLFTPRIIDDENDKVAKVEKAFHEILEEEHARLLQLVSESKKKGIPVQLYKQYTPSASDRMLLFDE